MWLCKGLDITNDSEIKHPSPPWCPGQGGVHPTDTESGGRISDGTDGTVAGLRPPEARDTEAMGEVRRGWIG